METILESIPPAFSRVDAHGLLRIPIKRSCECSIPKASRGGTYAGEPHWQIYLPEVFRLSLCCDVPIVWAYHKPDGNAVQRGSLNVAVTVATLRHQNQRSGYVIVFEDLPTLKAQKQALGAKWARRVAMRLKIRSPDRAFRGEKFSAIWSAQPSRSGILDIVRSCAQTIRGG